MNNIARQQQVFVDSLINRRFECSDDFAETGKCSLQERFGLYVHNSYQTWRDAVSSCYPITKKILGDKLFSTLVAEFVDVFPPALHDINYYGAEFVDFLKDSYPQVLESHPYLIELGTLEWYFYVTYYCADDEATTAEQWQAFSSYDVSSVKFTVSLSLNIFKTNWKLSQLWTSNDGEIGTLLKDEEEYIIIYRKKYKVETVALSELEYSVLNAIVGGLTLEELIDKFGESGASLLPLFINKCWLIGYFVCDE